jgi:hypothetical protein
VTFLLFRERGPELSRSGSGLVSLVIRQTEDATTVAAPGPAIGRRRHQKGEADALDKLA